MAVNRLGSNSASAGSDNAQNIGFAIAIDSAKDTIQQAIDSPLAPTGYMGVFTETVNSAMAYQLGLKTDTGAYVVSTSTDGPADAAGIQSGDVIVRVEDSAVNTAEDLGSILNDLQPGQTVSVTIDRDGNEQTVDVTLDARPLPTELP